MNCGRYINNEKLLKMVLNHKFTPVEEKIMDKIVSYIDHSRKYKLSKSVQHSLIEVLKFYILEIIFRKRYFQTLKSTKNLFIHSELSQLPDDIDVKSLERLSEELNRKQSVVRHKILLSKTFLPDDILALLN